MTISKADAAREILKRRQARKSLLAFIRYINPEYIVSDFSITVCAALDQFVAECMAGLRPVLILQAPPQHGKSDIVSRHLPAYIFGLFPELRIAGLSYGKDLASDMNRDVQRIMMSREYHKLFPDSSLNAKRAVNVDIEAKRNSETFELVGHKGTYIGQGVGGPLTGKTVNIGIIDDPIKNSKEALSPATKDSIWKWYGSTFLTRLSKTGGQIIMATRWATDDLSGRVLAANPKAKLLSFPATSGPEGEEVALIPELHPVDKLLETKAMLGDYFWSAMYMQSPKTIGGAIFKDTGVRHYLPNELPTKFEKIVQSWDMTFKDSEGTDFVVGQVWGKLGANCYLLYEHRERMSFTKSKAAVVAMTARFPQARRKLIEDKANGPAIMDSLKAEISGMIPVEPDGSKIARAHAITAEWEAGNIWLPHPDIAPWIKDWIDEITTFPAAANDDRVDAFTQAVRDLYSASKGLWG